jgi:hypothetical protein
MAHEVRPDGVLHTLQGRLASLLLYISHALCIVSCACVGVGWVEGLQQQVPARWSV